MLKLTGDRRHTAAVRALMAADVAAGRVVLTATTATFHHDDPAALIAAVLDAAHPAWRQDRTVDLHTFPARGQRRPHWQWLLKWYRQAATQGALAHYENTARTQEPQ